MKNREKVLKCRVLALGKKIATTNYERWDLNSLDCEMLQYGLALNMGTFRLGPSTVKMKVICPIVAIE